ncbi:hypothetical protein C2S52_003519 [Perilla frutescens var. hirtella]|nr:hypothetical protein C2S51_011517 [Perilla frutescens var. frutescens]KAH6793042.1 hypothetical protein C2S52_003519 [Perilla frutescens var. hirtella]
MPHNKRNLNGAISNHNNTRIQENYTHTHKDREGGYFGSDRKEVVEEEGRPTMRVVEERSLRATKTGDEEGGTAEVE